MKKQLASFQTRFRNRGLQEDGFSLIEMIVAITILAILAIAAFPFFARSLMQMDLNNMTTSASISAQTIIEDIRKDPTCAHIDSVIGGIQPFTDARGKEYTVEVVLPQACTNGSLIPIELTAIRTRDDRVLFKQNIQVLVLASGSYLEVD